VCKGRSNACNPLAPRIDKNLGNPVVKKVWVRTLADRRGIHLLFVNMLQALKDRIYDDASTTPLDG
jgi:hypothetical protein